ncbi:SpoIIE family protein phosphatase [Silvimonas soli]|uniref:SpoIIE family protein phosphatase n=1 Tax=Silvimonas soli TaxID=2980100 RepID=UPI0024B3C4A4|nr:SpoIIE family protein phosphatase [Silvimonas soli]
MPAQFNASRGSLPRFRQPSAADLCVVATAITSEETNQAVLDVFNDQRELISLPVVENGRPIGLINRNIFMSQMSKPFHRELYGKKSCIAFMDKEPLIAEATLGIESLTFRAVEYGEKALADGFIITRDGRYAGVGHGLQLMRVVADMQAEKNRQIMHSIDYASVIQRATLQVSRAALAETLTDASLVWEPRDVVGGDFYHFARFADGWFAAIADCTGHGVPGAFMTLISSSMLAQAIERNNPRDPAHLMGLVSRGIKQMLGQTAERSELAESNDGLDAAFMWFDNATQTLTFAGARTALYLLYPDAPQIEMIEGDRAGVGYVDSNADHQWTNRVLPLTPNTLLFVTTDGLVDQIGGRKQIAFGKRRIRDAIVARRHQSTTQITDDLLIELANWQVDETRRDDLTCLCVRIAGTQP